MLCLYLGSYKMHLGSYCNQKSSAFHDTNIGIFTIVPSLVCGKKNSGFFLLCHSLVILTTVQLTKALSNLGEWKAIIQKHYYNILHLHVDQMLQGLGTTNNINTARAYFEDWVKFAKDLKINNQVVKR